ncbi:MAG: DUF4760 domain-containing protein [Candidatus Pacebacteria bacterium]|nr:DUF4760 domain-containing protein [Candidatus Paceibacterota bacterium]
MEVALLIVLIVGFAAVLSGQVIGARKAKTNWKLQSLTFASNQFDRLSLIGAREEMRKLGDKDIMSYIGDDPAKTQKFLEYAYVFNRLGEGIKNGILDESIIFQTWLPNEFFVKHWERLKPLVEKERERRKIAELYGSFEWLADYAKKIAPI